MLRQRKSLFWPMSVLIVGLVFLSMLMEAPENRPIAAPLVQSDTYPDATAIRTATPYVDPDDDGSDPDDEEETETPTRTPTDTPTGDDAASPSSTDDTETPEEETNTPTDTATPRPTSEPTATPTDTPTPTPDRKQQTVLCIPGTPGIIEGDEAPPNISLLLSLERTNEGDVQREADRVIETVVGGGITDSLGNYVLRLEFEPDTDVEALKIEHVYVRERHTRRIIHTLTCETTLSNEDETPTEEDDNNADNADEENTDES